MMNPEKTLENEQVKTTFDIKKENIEFLLLDERKTKGLLTPQEEERFEELKKIRAERAEKVKQDDKKYDVSGAYNNEIGHLQKF